MLADRPNSLPGNVFCGDRGQLGRRWVAAVVLCIVIAAFIAPLAAAQGCAMCYESAAGAGAHGREALRHGILILLLPAASLFLGICGLVYHRRSVTR